jgi:hypothetical protein
MLAVLDGDRRAGRGQTCWTGTDVLDGDSHPLRNVILDLKKQLERVTVPFGVQKAA